MIKVLPEGLEDYVAAHSTPVPPLLAELITTTQRETGDRAVMLSGQVEGGLLQMLVFATGARRVLEVGTFTGFSAQMMAAALPADGSLITCDLDPRTIETARGFFKRSPHGAKIELREGPALETIARLEGPFDLVFIDADKERSVEYFDAAMALTRAGSAIIVDNAVRKGAIIDSSTTDSRVIGMRRLVEHVARERRVSATAIQTVGSKGYDGFILAVVAGGTELQIEN